MTSKILIADDHPLFRDALRSVVYSAMPDCEIAQARNYTETIEALEANSFSLVFLDLNMPDSNGLSDLALLKKNHPQTPIVVVSAHEDPNIIRACLKHNASGYIFKSTSPENIKAAIQKVVAGETCVPEGFAVDNEVEPNLAHRIQTLTPSQLTIFIEMGKGNLNKQIAYDLDISEATVKAHITTVFKKLKINNRTQAVILAKEHQASAPSISNT